MHFRLQFCSTTLLHNHELIVHLRGEKLCIFLALHGGPQKVFGARELAASKLFLAQRLANDVELGIDCELDDGGRDDVALVGLDLVPDPLPQLRALN